MDFFKDILQELTDPNAQPISGTDAAFLYTETANSPMHVGTLAIVEGSLSFDDFKSIIASRIHQLPKFRQKLVNVPFNLDYPYWADDANFDIDLHLHRMALPAPKDWNTLRTMASAILSNPLDLRRPLWSISLIEELDGLSQVPKGSVAMVAKVHHVMIDGISGVGIMGSLLDFDPKSRVDKNKPLRPFKPAPAPNELALLVKTFSDFVQNPLKLPRVASNTAYNLLKNQATNSIKPKEIEASSYSVPRTIFNHTISPKRSWGTTLLSLERLKKLKTIMEVSFNDIMLAICSTALRQYLLEKDKLPGQPLVAMVPVSTRRKDESNMDNQISSMFVPIATHIEDPIERLEVITEHTIQGKVRHQAMGAKTLSKMADAVPFGLANVASGIYSRYNLSQLHKPAFNVTITNVPGPQFPLYVNGHKVLNIMGMAPIIDGMGLIITIFSYNGEVTVSSTSDARTMPDVDKFSRYIREAANELEEIILSKDKKKKKIVKTKAQSDKFFTAFRKFLKENPKKTEKYEGQIQFHLTGDASSDWQLNLDKNPALIKKGVYSEPDATIQVKEEHFIRIAKGELGFQEAFIQGRIRVDGDMTKLMPLGDLLKEVHI